MWQYNYSPELYHYGVMGMKWGVRKRKRYNNMYTEHKAIANYYKQKFLSKNRNASYDAAQKEGNKKASQYMIKKYGKQTIKDMSKYLNDVKNIKYGETDTDASDLHEALRMIKIKENLKLK